MLSEQSYDRLVGAIYDAALDPKVWSEVVAELCSSFGIRYASIYTPFCAMVGLEPVWNANVDPEFIASWAKYAHRDVLIQSLWRRLPSGSFTYSAGDLYPREKLRTWDAYTEMWQPRGVGELVGVLVNGEDHRAGTLNLYYPELGEAEIAEAKEVVARLGRHVARSLKVHWHLTSARQRANSAQITLDMFQMGVVWVDEAAVCLFRNAELDRILDLKDGIEISAEGLLRIPNQAELPLAIQKAKEGAETALAVERSSGTQPFRLRVMPLPLRANALRLPRAAAIVFVSESVPPLEDKIEQARKLFNLTPAESRLLRLLAQGHDVAGAAQEIGVQIPTVRTQIKSLLAKCSASRQADLIRIVAYLP